jgi:hypothetical protein
MEPLTKKEELGGDLVGSGTNLWIIKKIVSPIEES